MMTDLMGGLDDATLHALLGSIGDPSQLDDLKDQLASARKLRDVNPEPTITSSPSNIPNIAGALSAVMDRRRGAQEEAQAKLDRQAVYDRQAKYSEQFLRALQGMQHPGAAPVPGQAAAPIPGPSGTSNGMYN